MSSKDERVVEMRFDNAQFEKGIKESMKTIDQFEKSLKMEGIVNSLSNIEKAASKFSLQGLSSAISAGIKDFGALGVAGVAAISNITNQAIVAGQRLANDAIRPIKSGFAEYETQINAVQTILANTSSKGTTLDQVNSALDELNVYADKTIYNFTQMTENIGRFTAAGVGLEDSVTAIKGISNLAAASGSDASQAARAMYNLSQALSMGKLTLMDWNSVVNAGMGGEMFQESLKETARVHGVAVDDMIAKQGSFRDSLSEGWITSEILLETLQKFTGDLSDEQLRSLGYTEDQIKAIQELGEMANNSATKVKTITQLFDTWNESKQSGWTQTWELLIGDFEEARSILTDISNILNGMTERSAKRRNDFLGEVLGTSKLESYDIDRWEKFAETGFATDELKEALIANARESGIAIDDLLAKYGSFEQTLQEGWLTKSLFDKTVNGTTTDAETMGKSLEALKQVVEEVENGLWGNADTGRYEKLAEAGWDWHLVQQLVNQDLQGGGVDWENLTEEQLASLGATQEQIAAFQELRAAMADENSEASKALEVETGREMILRALMNVISGVSKVLNIIRVAWESAFPAASVEQIQSLMKAFADWTEKLDISGETSVRVFNIFKGLFNALGIIVDIGGIVVDVIKNIFDAFPKSDSDFSILEMLSNAGEAITNFRQSLKDGGKYAEITQNITNAILNFAQACADAFAKFKSFISGEDTQFTFLNKIRDWFVNVYDKIKKLSFGGVLEKFAKFFSMGSAGAPSIEWLDSIISKLSELLKIDEIFGPIKKKLSNFASAIGLDKINPIKSISDWLSQKYKEDSNYEFNPLEVISHAFDGVKEWFANLDIDIHPVELVRGKIEEFKTFLSELDLPSGSDVIANIKAAWDGLVEWVSGLKFPSLTISNIKTQWEAFKTWITSKIDLESGFDPIASLKTAWSDVQSWFSTIDINLDVYEEVKKKIDGVKTWISDVFKKDENVDTSQGPFATLKAAIEDFANSPAVEKTLDIIGKLPAIFAFLVGGYTIKKIGDFFGAIADGILSIEGVGSPDITDKVKAIGEAIGILAIAAWACSSIDEEKFDSVLVGMGSAIASFLTAIGGATIAGKKGLGGLNDFSFVGLAAAIAALVLVVKIIAESDISVPDAIGAWALISALGLVASACVGLVNRIGGPGSAIKGIGTGFAFVGLSLAIKTLTKIVIQVRDSGISPEEAFGGWLLITALGLIASACVGLVNRIGGPGSAIKGIGTGFAFIGVSSAIAKLVGIVIAIRDSGIKSEEITDAYWILFLLGALVEAIVLLNSKFGSGFGSILGGAGFFLVAKGLQEVVKALDDLSKIDGKELQESIEGIIQAFAADPEATSTSVSSFVSGFIDGIVDAFVQQADRIVEIGKSIVSTIIGGLIDWNADVAMGILGLVGMLIDGIVMFLGLPSDISRIKDALFGMIDAALRLDPEAFNEAWGNFVDSIMVAFVHSLQSSEALSHIWDTIAAFVNTINEALGNGIHMARSDEFEINAEGKVVIVPKEYVWDPTQDTQEIPIEDAEIESVKLNANQILVQPSDLPGTWKLTDYNGFELQSYITTDELIMAAGENTPYVGVDGPMELVNKFQTPINEALRSVDASEGADEAVSNIVNSLQTAIEGSSDIKDAGGMIPEGAGEGIEENKSAVDEPLGVVAAHSVEEFQKDIDGHSPARVFIPIGQMIPEGVAEGINQGGSFILTALNNMANAMLTVTKQYPPQFTPVGVEIISALANGISSASGLPAIYARIAMESAANAVQGFRYQFFEAGRYAAEGLAEGIRVGGSSAITAAINMATNSIKAAKATLDENSPSREFFKIGRFGGLGMALGFDDSQKSVEKSSGGVASKAIEAVRNTFAILDSIVDGTFELNPVISPVLDLSNMRRANDAISQLLGHSLDETSARVDAAREATGERSDDYRTLNIYVDGAVVNDDEEIRAGALNMLYGLKRKAAL